MKSPNFSFLPDENLVSLASSAELFFRTHPVVSLFLLRRFGEILAQSIAAQLGIYTSEREKQLDLLNRLSRHLPDNIEDIFHDIRKAGNEAVHSDMGNYEIALKMLQNSRNLAIWYYQSFINSNYQALTFIPPLDPEQETNQLKHELLLLRKEAEQSRSQELKAWNIAQKEAELKSQSQKEIDQLQQQLHQLQQENSLIPEIKAELYILRSEAQNNILLNNQIKELEKQLYELNNIKEKYEELQEKANQKTTTQKHKTQILMQQNAVNLIAKNQKKPNSKITNRPTICLNPNCGKTIDNPQNYCTYCGNHLLLKNTYQPIQVLGEGGFGKVFKALNLDTLNKPCIIKQLIFNVTHSQFPIISRLFEQEAKQLDQLGEHPQIPRLIAYFEEENRYYIVQQFIEGKNLADLYDLEGSFSQAEIKDFLEQMSKILDFIHQEKVIHRDLKPENIIKNKDNKYFLIDFGISKELSKQNPTTSKMIGTEGYASPEQMSFNTKITYSSDIYSLGVTCISLLTGYFPNTVNQNKHLGKLYQNNQWNLTDILPKNFDPNLISIIEKMVKYQPTERYQSASDILTDLIDISINTEPSGDTEPTEEKIIYTLTSETDALTAEDLMDKANKKLAITSTEKVLPSEKIEIVSPIQKEDDKIGDYFLKFAKISTCYEDHWLQLKIAKNQWTGADDYRTVKSQLMRIAISEYGNVELNGFSIGFVQSIKKRTSLDVAVLNQAWLGRDGYDSPARIRCYKNCKIIALSLFGGLKIPDVLKNEGYKWERQSNNQIMVYSNKIKVLFEKRKETRLDAIFSIDDSLIPLILGWEMDQVMINLTHNKILKACDELIKNTDKRFKSDAVKIKFNSGHRRAIVHKVLAIVADDKLKPFIFNGVSDKEGRPLFQNHVFKDNESLKTAAIATYLASCVPQHLWDCESVIIGDEIVSIQSMIDKITTIEKITIAKVIGGTAKYHV